MNLGKISRPNVKLAPLDSQFGDALSFGQSAFVFFAHIYRRNRKLFRYSRDELRKASRDDRISTRKCDVVDIPCVDDAIVFAHILPILLSAVLMRQSAKIGLVMRPCARWCRYVQSFVQMRATSGEQPNRSTKSS